jgi:hypothetical protein
MINNPSYKGPWIAPRIKNPEYKVHYKMDWQQDEIKSVSCSGAGGVACSSDLLQILPSSAAVQFGARSSKGHTPHVACLSEGAWPRDELNTMPLVLSQTCRVRGSSAHSPTQRTSKHHCPNQFNTFMPQICCRIAGPLAAAHAPQPSLLPRL